MAGTFEDYFPMYGGLVYYGCGAVEAVFDVTG